MVAVPLIPQEFEGDFCTDMIDYYAFFRFVKQFAFLPYVSGFSVWF